MNSRLMFICQMVSAHVYCEMSEKKTQSISKTLTEIAVTELHHGMAGGAHFKKIATGWYVLDLSIIFFP